MNKNKRIFQHIALIILILFSTINASYGVTSRKSSKKKITTSKKNVLTLNELKEILSNHVTAKGCVLYDTKRKKIIFSKNPFKAMPPASLTKILTCIVAIEKTKNLDKEVTIKRNIYVGNGGVTIGLKKGDKIKMLDLLYMAMLYSANDACIAIAEEISGTEKKFLKEMNKFAKKIGVINSNFRNTNGMPKKNHYTTPYDLALISSYCMKNKTFKKVVGTKYQRVKINTYKKSKVRIKQKGDFEIAKQSNVTRKIPYTRSIRLKNRHKLLGKYNGIKGIKTGYTRAAGKCLATDYAFGNNEVVVIVLNSKNVVTDTINLIGYEKDYTNSKRISYNLD